MITISLCMIVKDEELTIGRCLDSIKDIADEIVIVDTGSRDNTKEIAEKYSSNIYDFEWVNDFALARNYSFSKATMDYILWLDADDFLDGENIKKFIMLKESMGGNIDVVMMKYNVAFDQNKNVGKSFFRERLLKRERNFKWYGYVHEYIKFDGSILNTDICITHGKLKNSIGRNLSIYKKLKDRGIKFSTRDKYYFASELFACNEFEEAEKYYKEVLETKDEPITEYIQTCMNLAKYYYFKNQRKDVLRVLYRSFEHGKPTTQICCMIASYYREIHDYIKAIFWYEEVLKLKKSEKTWGIILEDYCGYIPCIELCYCHYKLNNIEKAKKYNKMAEVYKKNDSNVLYNNKLFEDL